jgi:hypothetical protein
MVRGVNITRPTLPRAGGVATRRQKRRFEDSWARAPEKILYSTVWRLSAVLAIPFSDPAIFSETM